MYSLTKSRVKLENGYTDYFRTTVGTRQGCCLSPSLCNLYLNDMAPCFNQGQSDPMPVGDALVNFLAFADDIVFVSSSVKGLQNCLTKLESYCNTWKLTLNMTKTKIIVFNTTHKNHKFYYNGKKIQESDSYTYLGIVFKKNGLFCSAVNTLNSKAMKAQFAIRQGFADLSVKSQLKVYDSLVKPISLYGVEIWGAYLCNWQSGRYPLLINICIAILKFWIHARTSSHDSLIFQASCAEITSNVSKYLPVVLKIIGRNIDIDNMNTSELTKLVRGTKAKLIKCYERLFFKKINVTNDTPSKFREYMKVKHSYRIERYLLLIIENIERQFQE